MDKNVKCGVIRDLLPLVVDEVANPDSVELVNAHMEECEACRGYYEGMTAAIARTANPAPESDKVFLKLGRKMKMQNSIRKWITRALAGLLVFILCVAGYEFVDRKLHYTTEKMEIEWADAVLYYESDGQLAAQVRMQDGHRWYNAFSVMWSNGTVYIMPFRPAWSFKDAGGANVENIYLHDLRWEDGKVVEVREDYESWWDETTGRWEDIRNEIRRPVTTIRWGTPEQYTTLYVEGEEIPSFYEMLNMDRDEEGVSVRIVENEEAEEKPEPVRIEKIEDAAGESDEVGNDEGETPKGAALRNPAKGTESP